MKVFSLSLAVLNTVMIIGVVGLIAGSLITIINYVNAQAPGPGRSQGGPGCNHAPSPYNTTAAVNSNFNCNFFHH